jgi:DNA-directed RNA polymerase beta subunit
MLPQHRPTATWTKLLPVIERQQTRAFLADPWPADQLSGGDPSGAFERFLQRDVPPEERQEHGLHRVFSSIFPIRDFNELVELHFVNYRVTPPALPPEECRRRSETYAGSLHLTLRLVVFDVEDPGKSMAGRVRSIRDIKEQEVYLCEIPWKTRENTFVIDGIDRILLRQITESPGVRFLPGQGGKLKATLTPHRGSRLSFELDHKGLLWTRVDARKKRFLATTLLRALGFSSEQILVAFCSSETILLGPGGQHQVRLDPATLRGQRCIRDIRVGDEILVRKHQKFTGAAVGRLRALGIDRLPVDGESLLGRPLAHDVVHQDSGEVLREVNKPLRRGDLEMFHAAGLSEISLVLADGWLTSPIIPETLRADRNATEEDALCAIYSALRPGEAPTVETARYYLENLLFHPARYDLSAAGRRSLLRKLHGDIPGAPQSSVLTREDLLATIHELLHRDLRGLPPDDLDHLQAAVVRRGQRVAPGDLLAAGPGVACGEAALGHNLMVALVSGLTFGASLVVSERVLHQGKFTTLRLREHRIFAASTGDGEEAFTAEIPGVDGEDRAHLDGRGLARVGARVRGGELLIGRVRTRSWGTLEEPPEVTDRSLRMPAGRDGVVIGAWLEKRREASMPRKAQARARVLVAELHPLSPGDLLGSRHGDRGTVARIAPVEDMPLLPDGTPVDLMLNPAYIAEEGAAGVLMELLAGALGIPLVAPPFSTTLTEAQLRARLGGDGRVWLRDGTTGEFLENPATVGTLYVMKLPPLVGEVSEARSTGPVDLLTELPVEADGVAPGQLLDEDSVAALMAHGAAFSLREMLVHKGDAPAAREAVPWMLREHEEPADHVTQGLDALMRELRAAALEIQGKPPAPAPPSTRQGEGGQGGEVTSPSVRRGSSSPPRPASVSRVPCPRPSRAGRRGAP